MSLLHIAEVIVRFCVVQREKNDRFDSSEEICREKWMACDQNIQFGGNIARGGGAMKSVESGLPKRLIA